MMPYLWNGRFVLKFTGQIPGEADKKVVRTFLSVELNDATSR